PEPSLTTSGSRKLYIHGTGVAHFEPNVLYFGRGERRTLHANQIFGRCNVRKGVKTLCVGRGYARGACALAHQRNLGIGNGCTLGISHRTVESCSWKLCLGGREEERNQSQNK